MKRLLVWALLSSFVSLSWITWRARAAAVETGWGLGRILFETLVPTDSSPSGFGPSPAVESHQLVLNGANMIVESIHVPTEEPGTVDRLVQRMRVNCRTPLAAESAENDPLFDIPVIAAGTETERQLMCFRPRFSLNAEGAAKGWEAFQETRDLSAWGRMQALYVRQRPSGVSVLSIESTGPLRLEEMFPSHDDAPGADPEELPRPLGRRVISLSRAGRVALAIYQADRSTAGLLRDFESRARARALPVRAFRTAEEPPQRALFLSAKGESFVATVDSKDPGQTQGRIYLVRLP